MRKISPPSSIISIFFLIFFLILFFKFFTFLDVVGEDVVEINLVYWSVFEYIEDLFKKFVSERLTVTIVRIIEYINVFVFINLKLKIIRIK